MKNTISFNVLLYLLLVLGTVNSHAQEFDIVIKNGYLIDTKNNIDKKMDLAIKDSLIVKVANNIKASDAKKVIDAEGLYIAPGLIDMHSHNFFGTEPEAYLSNSFSSLPPDGFTFRTGVTTTVDAGGAGWRNFRTFKEQTIDRSKTRVLAFLNIVGSGMQGGAVEQNVNDMDAKLTAIVAKQYPQFIVGIKLAHFNGFDWTPTERAVKAGELANVPVMIDFGGSEPELSLTTLFMDKLRPGDIFTHAYAHVKGRTPLVDQQGNVADFAWKAQERGIIFDVGHGGGSFLFEQVVPAMEKGFIPNSISTDLHTGSMNGGMKDLANIMSKFLNLNMPLKEVIAATTWYPAKFIKREDLGHLTTGALADVVILNLRKGDFGFIDSQGKKMKGDKKLECELTIKNGQVVYDLNGMAANTWNE